MSTYESCYLSLISHKRKSDDYVFLQYTFKIINGNTPTYLQDLIKPKNSSYSFRYSNTVEQPMVGTTRYGLHSFRYVAPKLWNNLPQEILGAF